MPARTLLLTCFGSTWERQYPKLPKDVKRRLRQGGTALAARPQGERAVIRFDRDPEVIASLRAEITAAWAARCHDTGRPADLDWWASAWSRASEVATLRVSGELAAWVLARDDVAYYRVLAAQMVSGFAWCFPGRMLEAVLIGRVMTDYRLVTQPRALWPFRRPGPRVLMVRKWNGIIWGADAHRDALVLRATA